MKVFIAGSPRSGTSILFFALKSIFEIPGDGESHVMPVFQGMVHHLRSYLDRFKANQDPITLKRLDRSATEQFLFDYVRQFYGEVYPDGSWIDKTPTDEAVFGMPLIETIFPDARLIVTKRNGIEVVSSYVKKFNSNFEDACVAWSNAMQGLVHARSFCKNLLEVDQYDFLNAGPRTGRRIAAHLGAPDRAEDITVYLTNERVEKSSTYDQKIRLRLTDTDWSADQKEKFKRHCGQMMTAFQYEM